MVKRVIYPVIALAVLSASLYSCKDKKNADAEATDQKTTEPTTTTEESKESSKPAAAEPKTYTVVFTPDTVRLGKNKEALIKIKDAKAVELSDPDGKVTGIELSYSIEVTNKNSIGGSSVFINPNNFRLTLDNGNNITHDTYNTVGPAAESTETSSGNIFKIPAGAKPKTLNLFHDETRVSVAVELK